LEKLKIIQDEKKEFMNKKNEMYSLSKQFEASAQNLTIKHETVKEATMARLEFIRASNDMVRKISEKRSLEFEDKINKLERDLFDLIKEQNDMEFQIVDRKKIRHENEDRLQKIMTGEPSKKEIDSLKKRLISQQENAEKNIKIAEGYLNRASEINTRGKEIEKEIIIITESFDFLIDFLDGEKS